MPTISGEQLTPLRMKLGIYLLFLSIYLVFASGHFWSTDHVAVFLTTQSLVEDHNPSIKRINNTAVGRDGKSYSVFGLGQSVAAMPLYLAGSAVDDIGSRSIREYFQGPSIGDWGGTVQIFFVSLFNQLVAPLICVLAFMFLRRFGFSIRVSFFATLVFGLGTGTFVAAHDFFQHPLETLLILSSIYVLFANRQFMRIGHALAAGALLGLGMLTRFNVVLIAPLLACYVIAVTPRLRRGAGDTSESLVAPRVFGVGTGRGLENAAAFAIPVTLALVVMLILNYWRFADPLAFNPIAADQGFSPQTTLVGLYGNTLSPGRSIFLYSPPILLAFFGAAKFYAAHREEAVLFGAIVCVYFLFYSSFNIWYGGWSWGPRYLLPAVPLLVVPASYVMTTLRGQIAAAVLGVLGFAIQILGSVENVSYVTFAHLNGVLTDAFLFQPAGSPVPTHLRDLLANRNVDLWLVYIQERFGTPAMLLTLVFPALIMSCSIMLLGPLIWPSTGKPGVIVPVDASPTDDEPVGR